MAAKFTLPPHVPSVENLLLCAQCRDVTSTTRGLCVKCGHPSVFLLRDAINGGMGLPEMEDADFWIMRLLYDLLITEERTRAPEPPSIPAV